MNATFLFLTANADAIAEFYRVKPFLEFIFWCSMPGTVFGVFQLAKHMKRQYQSKVLS